MHRKKNSKVFKISLYIIGLLVVGIIGFSISSMVNSPNKNTHNTVKKGVKKSNISKDTSKSKKNNKNNDSSENNSTNNGQSAGNHASSYNDVENNNNESTSDRRMNLALHGDPNSSEYKAEKQRELQTISDGTGAIDTTANPILQHEQSVDMQKAVSDANQSNSDSSTQTNDNYDN